MLGLCLISACGPTGSRGSRADNQTLADATRAAAMIVPEMAPTQSVLVSEMTIMDRNPGTLGTPEIAEGILNAGVDLVVIENAEKALNKVVPEMFTSLTKLKQKFGDKVQFSPHNVGHKTEWVRDYGPVTAQTSDGQHVFIDFRYFESASLEDKFTKEFGRKRQISVFESSIKIEGGNFMIDENGTCVVSKLVRAINTTFDLTSAPYYCRQVVELESLPYEKTGHIDLFVKFVGQKIVLVGDFSKDQARLAKPGSSFDTNVFANHLTSIQATFTRLGYQVVKVPMPIPSTVRYNKNDQLEPWEMSELLIRSYLNSLLLNRDGRRIALVPRFEKQKIRRNHNVKDDSENSDSPPKDLGTIDYPDRDLLPNYEATVREAYKKAGYEVQFIPSDHLVASAGAVHCLTMQIPQKKAP